MKRLLTSAGWVVFIILVLSMLGSSVSLPAYAQGGDRQCYAKCKAEAYGGCAPNLEGYRGRCIQSNMRNCKNSCCKTVECYRAFEYGR
jgi:hypothetical protein